MPEVHERACPSCGYPQVSVIDRDKPAGAGKVWLTTVTYHARGCRGGFVSLRPQRALEKIGPRALALREVD